MKWMTLCLPALLLAAGCSTYSTSGDSDAGTDAGIDAIADAGADPGSGDDGRPDAGDRQGDDDTCRAEPPRNVGLQIGDDPWAGGEEMAGYVQVLYSHPPEDGQWSSEVWLWSEDDAHLSKLFLDLPEGFEAPLRLGEELWAWTSVWRPWWIDQTLVVREEGDDGELRFHVIDRSYTRPGFSPACTPAMDAMGCGTVVFPETTVQPHPDVPEATLSQGANHYAAGPNKSRAYWTFVGSLYQYVEVFCTDLPGGWLQLAEIDLTRHSQCACTADSECSVDRVCEVHNQRCVPDLCRGMPPCSGGEVCDPYRGQCVPGPAERCLDDGDCGGMQICNGHTGQCIEDVCMLMDCFGPCSSLLGRCYTCLYDCDCWPGRCDPETTTCDPACQGDKIDFDQDNPDGFELFHVCIDERMEEAAELLAKYVGSVQCRVTPPQGTCDLGVDQACVGELHRSDPEGRRISDAQWYGLCALTRLPVVARIRGGYYMP